MTNKLFSFINICSCFVERINDKTRNRYVIASAGITLHLMIGGVYAWSVFTGPIVKQTGSAETSVSFAFSLAIFFLGMSAALMGRLVEKFGPTNF